MIRKTAIITGAFGDTGMAIAKKFAVATEYVEADYKAYNDLKARYDHLMHEWEKASYEVEIVEEG